MVIRCHVGTRHAAHVPRLVVEDGQSRPSRDVPARVDALRHAAEAAGLVPVPPLPLPAGLLEQVHSAVYLDFLRGAHARWVQEGGDPAQGVVPGVPGCLAGAAARFMTDALAPIHSATWAAAEEAAALAVGAACDVLGGAPLAYAICRPPGHHAGRAFGGGAAYVNNAALAATVLRDRFDRVLVLDIDVHHGNGTQEIFATRDDVFTLSLHRDPVDYYPHCPGFASEAGQGEGLGFCLNVPLPAGTGDAAYLAALGPALHRAMASRPGALVVSLGFDAHVADPVRGLCLSDAGFTAIGAAIARLALPTVLVQEGGYALDRLGAALTSFLSGLMTPALPTH